MKVRVTKTTTGGGDGSKKQPIDYSGWGNQANTAATQGWFPETTLPNGEVTWRSNYSPAFNDVYNPQTPNIRGHMAVIQRPDKKFDIVIRDNNYKVLNRPLEGVNSDVIQNYLTNAQSTVAQRNQRAINNTPSILMALNK